MGLLNDVLLWKACSGSRSGKPAYIAFSSGILLFYIFLKFDMFWFDFGFV